ncbi:recombinase [Phaeobacter sp. HS012]|nr:recombinase [Phaeobacter inhibens]MBQ4807380.1 recombinase [Phaeobacter sp. HS012]MBQ4881956.1 recombinase [Phaeobacter sp. HS011]UWR50903.1 recombinase [Phaeobacter inhibens]UWR54743.1 recombinase [Phaeobacter inhibens]
MEVHHYEAPTMSTYTPENRLAKTADLLFSLHSSIERLRQEAEQMLERLACDEDEGGSTPRIAKLESLIRDSQKVEKTLVEQSEQHQAAAGLDIKAARDEIENRLARLRASLDAEDVSGPAQRS